MLDSRRLTAQEMCRIQTFPDGLSFDCGRTDVQKMIGNAVPSLLAEVLAREIRRQLLDDEWETGPLQLIPPVRSPVPKPEPLEALPTQYGTLIGDYADHPGNGRLRVKKTVKHTDVVEGQLFPAAE